MKNLLLFILLSSTSLLSAQTTIIYEPKASSKYIPSTAALAEIVYTNNGYYIRFGLVKDSVTGFMQSDFLAAQKFFSQFDAIEFLSANGFEFLCTYNSAGDVYGAGPRILMRRKKTTQ